MKTIGIAAHSYEGGALCFLEACREGGRIIGTHLHPDIILSAIPMGLSMEAWEADRYDDVWPHLRDGIVQVADAGADFFVCPDNTAHIALEKYISRARIPGLHIAQVVCHQIMQHGWTEVGLLGTKWTMTGPVYAQALAAVGLHKIIPPAPVRSAINTAIFDDLCLGIFAPATIELFLNAIDDLKREGAQCVILGCTEIPLIVTPDNASLPILDSTRLLAQYAVRLAISDVDIVGDEWIDPTQVKSKKKDKS